MKYLKTYEYLNKFYNVKQSIKGSLGLKSEKDKFISKFIDNKNIYKSSLSKDGKFLNLYLKRNKGIYVVYIEVTIKFDEDGTRLFHPKLELTQDGWRKINNYISLTKDELISSKKFKLDDDFTIFKNYYGMGFTYMEVSFEEFVSNIDYNFDMNGFINKICSFNFDQLIDCAFFILKSNGKESKDDVIAEDVRDIFIELESLGKSNFEYTNLSGILSMRLNYDFFISGRGDYIKIDDNILNIMEILKGAKKRLELLGELIEYNFSTKDGISIEIKIKTKND